MNIQTVQMKIIVFIILFANIIQGQELDLDQRKIVKNLGIKEMKIYNVGIENGLPTEELILKSSRTFNQNGFEIQIVKYTNEEKEDFDNYIYKSDSVLIEKIMVFGTRRGRLTRTMKYEYNSKNQVKKRSYYSSNILKSFSKYRYNRKGKIKKANSYILDFKHPQKPEIKRNIQTIRKLSYNKKNQLVKMKVQSRLNRKGVASKTVSKLEYSKDGKHVKTYDTTNGKKRKVLLSEDKYDAQNRLVAEIKYPENKSMEIVMMQGTKGKKGGETVRETTYLNNGLIDTETIKVNDDVISAKKYTYEN